jgi:hypothetical protein
MGEIIQSILIVLLIHLVLQIIIGIWIIVIAGTVDTYEQIGRIVLKPIEAIVSFIIRKIKRKE